MRRIIFRHFLHISSLSSQELDSLRVAACSVSKLDYSGKMKSPRKEIVEPSSVLVITVHKARNIERKGFIGKADPFVRVNYKHEDKDSSPVIKNMNPVWNFTAYFNLYSDEAENKVRLKIVIELLKKLYSQHVFGLVLYVSLFYCKRPK